MRFLGPLFMVSMASAAPLQVLSYSSLTGKGSLGEAIQQEFAKTCTDCSIKFMDAGALGGLLGRVRADAKRSKRFAYEVVLGLDALQLQALKTEGRVLAEQLIDHGPFAIVVDSEKLPPSAWPKSWQELPSKLTGKLIVQDPRSSATGLGWLRALYEMKALAPELAKKLVARSYPGWSEAYSAFQKGRDGAVAVWTYAGSAAYHACEEKTRRYQALPLAEGYPEHQEWAVLLKPLDGGEPSPRAQKLLALVASAAVQSQVPTRQWMWPGDSKIPLPECFRAAAEVKRWQAPRVPELRDITRWTDEWSR